MQIFGGVGFEIRQADMQIAGLEFLGLDADQRNGAAHDGDFFRSLGILVQDGQLHGFALGSANLGDRVLQGNVQSRNAVDFEDDIPGSEARLVRRSVLDGSDDGQALVPDSDLDSDTAEFALKLLLHHPKLFEINICGMRVYGIEHALDGTVDQIRAVDFLDIVFFDQIQNLAELFQSLVVIRIPSLAG